MVAFGDTINRVKSQSSYPASAYLEYTQLKGIIYDLQLLNLREPIDENAMSLSVTPATNAAAMPTPVVDDDDSEDDRQLQRVESMVANGTTKLATHEEFLSLLEAELRKMDKFTHDEVIKVRRTLRELEGYQKGEIAACTDDFEAWCHNVGATFLELEKYVNLNVTAVRKLLKKHDKVLPNLPSIKAFYTARMHDMRWVRNDYSDVVVRLSRLYAKVEAARLSSESGLEEQKELHKQYDEHSFVRTTYKFWVKPDDVSAVKLAISKHLPVFLQPGMTSSSAGSGFKSHAEKDSQLVNSVYLDSSTLELYHCRLAKSHGAVALRLRWYGTGEPTLVYVERKTHRDGWTGDESVKERFAIPPEQVPLLLRGSFDADAHEASARESGNKAEVAIRQERQLVDDVAQLITSKRLVPTVRSQCTRCAFQLRHTNAVRASMDTNLCIISEVQHATPPQPETAMATSISSWMESQGSGCEIAQSQAMNKELVQRDQWYRDPRMSIPRTEITRFPFAVLEIKLALSESDELPEWVRELVNSKALIPVHKFSKFIHGTAVLLPDEVQAMPYWIDDPALAASISAVGRTANSISRPLVSPLEQARGIRPHTTVMQWNQTYQIRRSYENDSGGDQLGFVARRELPSRFSYCHAFRRNSGGHNHLARGGGEACCVPAADLDVSAEMQQLLPAQKIEPKLLLAAERTLLHWLHAAVVLTTSGAVGLAFANSSKRSGQRAIRADIYGVLLSIVACTLAGYGLVIYSWRVRRLVNRSPTEWGDPLGPLVIGALTIICFATVWCVELASPRKPLTE